MKTFNYPYCVIHDDEVYVSESPIDMHPLRGMGLLNVEINIDDNGIVDICGDEIQYGFIYNREKLSNLKDTPHESHIKHCKGLKLFGFYLIKPYDYVDAGWHRLKVTTHKRIILNKYKIVFQ